jgi:alpha-tubulin suppressor-like RCC1 family protein
MNRWLAIVALLAAACDGGVRTNETRSAEAISTAGARPYGSLAMGEDHGCALGRDGNVYCWGNNLEGELGDGSTAINRLVPAPVTGIGNQVFVGAANATSCSVGADGTVHCWGFNNQGQLGNGTTGGAVNGGDNTPQLVMRQTWIYTLPLNSIVEVSIGDLHTCARESTGNVWCWGYNIYGEIGDGTTDNRSYATFVSGVNNAIQLATGSYHSCALLADHTVSCWGYNGYGQLGNGTQTNSSTPVAVPGLANVVALSAMAYGTCALLADGTARCWGVNAYGEMGNGTTSPSQLTPTPVSLSGISSLARAASSWTMCATLAAGGARCWGYNGDGETGSGTTSWSQPTPIAVGAMNNSPPSEVALGLSHGCARTSDGNLWCWGANGAGQLGNNSTTASSVPVYNFIPQWMSPSQRIAHTNGSWGTVCAITSAEGHVECWGEGDTGNLGNGTLTTVQSTPVYASGLSNIIAIAGGDASFTALRSDGTVWCWGEGRDCGGGQPLFQSTPVQVPGIAGAVAIASSCAVLANGTLWCWGDNNPPTQVSGLTNVVAVSGDGTRCAILADGTLWCWGYNFDGEVGNGTAGFTWQLTPVQVSGLSGVVAVSGNFTHKCALRSDGTVWCWGLNGKGQLGDGTTTTRTTPVQVNGIYNAVAVAAHDIIGNEYGTSCAILVDGTVRCWGSNDSGQLGNGTTTTAPQTAPVIVSGLSNAFEIALGPERVLAVGANGTLWGWGDNAGAELGPANIGGIQTTPIQLPFAP